MSGGGPVLVGPWVRRAAGRRAHHGDVGASSAAAGWCPGMSPARAGVRC